MDDRRKYHGLHDESSRGQSPSSCALSFRCYFDPQILKYPFSLRKQRVDCSTFTRWKSSIATSSPCVPPQSLQTLADDSHRQTSSSTAIFTLVSPTTDSSRLYRIRTLSIPVARLLPPSVPFDIWHRNYSIPQASVWTPAIRQGKVTCMPSES